MRAARFFAGAILAIVCAGCVASENGIALPDGSNVVFDPTLLGDWVTAEAKTEILASGKKQYTEERFFRIERKQSGPKTYHFTDYRVPRPENGAGNPEPVPDENSPSNDMDLVQIGDALFFDWAAKNETQEVCFHMICRLKHDGDSLAFLILKPSFFREHPQSLRHTVGKDHEDSIMLSATSDELRAFLGEHADDPAVWEKSSGPNTRRRKSDLPAK